MYISQSLAGKFCRTLSSSQDRTTQLHFCLLKSSRLSRFCHIGHCENCLCFDATIRHRKSMSDKNIHQKINISLPASIMTGD